MKSNNLISLNKEELLGLINIINELCNGIYVNDFEKSIGVSITRARELLAKIEDNETLLKIKFSSEEMGVFINAIDEVLRQIEDWELQTRISISQEEAILIREKLLGGMAISLTNEKI